MAPQIRQHMLSFFAGGVSALSFGYYQLHQDVWRAADLVDSHLGSLGRETVSSQTVLLKRVGALEAETKSLRELLATKGIS